MSVTAGRTGASSAQHNSAVRSKNMRSQGDGKGISLAPPLVMTLERSLEYIAPDEYVEATPKSLRLRKKILDANLRKRSGNLVKV